jgi:DNA-binding HxlR family transcriptional regulator
MLGTILEESLNMSIESIEQAKLENTGFSYTLSLINGKYKIIILYYLTAFEVVRFNEMKRYIGTVSFKTLSLSLKELESDGLIIRKEYPQIPPKVEYSLSAHGKSLIPILEAMCEWGELHKTTAKKK